jgi:hypothetical protein
MAKVECPGCEGTKQMECPECWDNGYSEDCKTCLGDGIMPCNECSGTGEIED